MNMTMEVTDWASGLSLIIAGFLAWCFYRVAIRSILSPLRVIPSPTTSNILFGNAFDVFLDFPSFFVRWARRLESGIVCVRLYMGWRFVALCDKDSIKHVLVDNVDNYKTPCQLVSAFFKINTSVEQNRRNRQMFLTANGKLKHISVTQQVSECLIAKWRKKASSKDNLVELESDILKSIMDIDFKTTSYLSTSQSEDYFNEVIEHENDPSWKSYLSNKVSRVFATTKTKPYQEILDKYDELVEKTTSSLQDKMQTHLLSHLLMLNHKDTKISKEQILQKITSFHDSSIETTSTTITRCLQILARHRRIQERVAKEVTSHLPPPGQPITEACLEKMAYLGCIINEVLRLYSPTPIVLKEAIEDDVINGYTVPRGTVIACVLSALHRNSEYWENPEEFNPERFFKENINEHTFIPFGAGRNKSVEIKMSVVEMKLTLALILRHFRVRPHEGQVYETIYNGSLKQSPSVKCRLLPMEDLKQN